MTKKTDERLAHWGISRRWLFIVLFILVSASTTYFVIQSHRLFDEVVTNITGFKTTEGRTFLSAYQTGAETDQLEVLARTALEIDTTDARHNRSTSALVTRTWLRFTSAAFGAILITFGTIFILSRVTIDTTTIGGEWEKAKINLAFNSPGIFLVFTGAVLLTLPITSKQEIDTNDTASFFGKLNANDTGMIAKIGRVDERTKMFCKREPKPNGC